jgi:hypothetical protein
MGIDPGLSGALVIIDSENRQIVRVWDIPTYLVRVRTKTRKCLDHRALVLIMREASTIYGVKLAVLEAVGGRPKQSASAAFSFGMGYGMVYMACSFADIPLEPVPPARWKQLMNIPGKNKATDGTLIRIAEEKFPRSSAEFRGCRGGLKVDRAEAALMALFGVMFIWEKTVTPQDVAEFKGLYEHAVSPKKGKPKNAN